MLDLAALLKDNSRLGMEQNSQDTGLMVILHSGCQIRLTKALDGVTVTLPALTRNFYVDGHTPKPH